MPQKLPLFAVIIASAVLIAACGEDSPPAAPTPPPTTTPPPVSNPPPTPPPSEPASLASVTLNPSTIASQGTPEGTVTLTAAAPAGSAVVALFSNNRDVAKVPENVTVAAGATSATFRVETSTVRTPSTVRIEATYAGVTRTTDLTVQSPVLQPLFSVSSPNRTDACDIVDGNGAVDCQLNASASTGFPARYLWTLRIGSSSMSFSVPDDQAVTTPVTNCGFLGNGTNEDGKFRMDVILQLEDRSGDKSDTLTRSVTVHHNGRCGF